MLVLAWGRVVQLFAHQAFLFQDKIVIQKSKQTVDAYSLPLLGNPETALSLSRCSITDMVIECTLFNPEHPSLGAIKLTTVLDAISTDSADSLEVTQADGPDLGFCKEFMHYQLRVSLAVWPRASEGSAVKRKTIFKLQSPWKYPAMCRKGIESTIIISNYMPKWKECIAFNPSVTQVKLSNTYNPELNSNYTRTVTCQTAGDCSSCRGS
ncbi:hypothetical protein B0H34DRAFT_674953 [Crassisporium funariophilum]|nr:hypothetical protein B0H34DRAFT_674953 [Crassisporium funariophilum]